MYAILKYWSFDTSCLKFTFVLHFGPQNVSEIGPKLVSESMLEGFRGALGGAQTSKIDFNSLVAANMGPSWRQAGANLAPASDQ